MISISAKGNFFEFSSGGTEIFNELTKLVQENGYSITYEYSDIPIGRTTFENNIFKIEVNRHFSNIKKEMVIIHELLHAKQIISGIIVQNFKFEKGFEVFEELYNAIQGFVLDAPIHKQLFEYGYDITLITKTDYDALLEFYSKSNIKPMFVQEKQIPMCVAELYFAYSIEAYNQLMQTILNKDKEEYETISNINLLLKRFVNSEIIFATCFQSIVDTLTK